MYAIVKTGGKQYRVSEGTVLSVEKLAAEVGDEVELPVLLVSDGSTTEATPSALEGKTVTAKVLDHHKDVKKLVYKFHKRKRYHRLRGHRQQLTSLEVVSIPEL